MITSVVSSLAVGHGSRKQEAEVGLTPPTICPTFGASCTYSLMSIVLEAWLLYGKGEQTPDGSCELEATPTTWTLWNPTPVDQ